MRILAFSDLHGDAGIARALVAASQAADVLVGAGDYGTRGVDGEEVLDLLLAGSHAPVVLVHGNHDDPGIVEKRCRSSQAGRYLHGEAVRLGDVVFFGLGGEVPRRTEAAWNVGGDEGEAEALLAAGPAGAVLVTHAPPFGIVDRQPDGRHDGSRAIRSFIETRKPVLHLCGHVHSAWRSRGALGGTPVYNLGPAPTWIEVGP